MIGYCIAISLFLNYFLIENLEIDLSEDFKQFDKFYVSNDYQSLSIDKRVLDIKNDIPKEFSKIKNDCLIQYRTIGGIILKGCYIPEEDATINIDGKDREGSSRDVEVCHTTYDFKNGWTTPIKNCQAKDCMEFKGGYYYIRPFVSNFNDSKTFCENYGMDMYASSDEIIQYGVHIRYRRWFGFTNPQDYWMGLVWNSKYKKYTLLDGSLVTYDFATPPEENLCVIMKDYNWVTKDCNEKYATICKSKNDKSCSGPIWGAWEPWGDASATCNMAKTTRRRKCFNPPDNPVFTKKDCDGNFTEVVEFFTNVTCPGWNGWLPWTPCSESCGFGIVTRQRFCIASNPRTTCDGNSMETKKCKLRDCPRDGRWGTWEMWNVCSRTCGTGSRTRIRLCNNPPPKYGGKECDTKEAMEIEKCFNKVCPVSRIWSPWLDWSECSQSCDLATRRRERKCIDPLPGLSYGNCPGLPYMIRNCKFISCEEAEKISNGGGRNTDRQEFGAFGPSGFGGRDPLDDPNKTGGLGKSKKAVLTVIGVICGLVVSLIGFYVTKNTLFRRDSIEREVESGSSSSDSSDEKDKEEIHLT